MAEPTESETAANAGISDYPPMLRVGDRIGDYELLEVVGVGGMGRVYKARERSMDRLVALKVLSFVLDQDVLGVVRFYREAQAAGRLSHPGIIPVYSVGQTDGVHYYAMELVEGPSIADLLDRLGNLPPQSLHGSLIEETGFAEEYPGLSTPPGETAVANRYIRSCVAMAADVAGSIAAAHAEGIIHRDLKPSNILIHHTNRPMLVDFGLARDNEREALTGSGVALGTPSYMAPEQVHGDRDIDGRVDIYGLGATLYEMLALQAPFAAATPDKTFHKIINEDPVPLRKRNPRVPRDLALIVHTCLAKRPEDRYPDAVALESDLWSFLMGNEVAAKPPTALQRARQFAGRHRRAVWTAIGTLVVSGLIAVIASVLLHHQSVQEGMVTLAAARHELVDNADVLAARELYGRAEVLLPDPSVLRDARLEHAREAFQRLYPQRIDVLRDLVDGIPASDRVELAPLLERLEGRGTIAVIVLAAKPEDAQISVRAHDQHERGNWRPLLPREPLPIGEYLVRVQSRGKTPTIQRALVERDRETRIHVHLYDQDSFPAGMVQVTDPDTGRSFAMARTELSWAALRAVLERVTDPNVKQELQPRVGRNGDDRPDRLPVQGLSFRQARTLAALMGGHLPSEREFWLAATGGLQSLRYPWGNRFEARRIIADPNYRDSPQPVNEHAEGASPLGILHLLGNVAELLSPTSEGPFLLAGGHYQSLDPESMRLTTARSWLREVRGPDAQGIYSGMRLARFLPQPDDAERQEAAARSRAAIQTAGVGSMLHDWRVDASGVGYELVINGTHARTRSQMDLFVSTRGFLQGSSFVATDGHNRKLRTNVNTNTHGELGSITVQLPAPAQRGQRYRLRLSTRLSPLSGLTMERDRYVLRIPMQAAGTVALVHRVRLPAGCQVEHVDPLPTYQYRQAGETFLVWELSPQPSESWRMVTAMVRFRCDGLLAGSWPASLPVQQFAKELLRALSSGDRDTLRHKLHLRYLQRPSGLGFRELVNQHMTQVHERFLAPRFQDVTAVGSTVTVELLADWTTKGRHGKDVTVRSWPLRLQLLETKDGLRALRIAPRTERDRGHVDATGVYRHKRLRVTIRPPLGVSCRRTHDELTAMQTLFVHPEHPADVRFQVLGHFSLEEESRDAVLLRLSNGAVAMRTGQLLDPAGNGKVMNWIFGDSATTKWARERWTLVQRGRRFILIKAIAAGRNRGEAERVFEEQLSWFESMLESVSID